MAVASPGSVEQHTLINPKRLSIHFSFHPMYFVEQIKAGADRRPRLKTCTLFAVTIGDVAAWWICDTTPFGSPVAALNTCAGERVRWIGDRWWKAQSISRDLTPSLSHRTSIYRGRVENVVPPGVIPRWFMANR